MSQLLKVYKDKCGYSVNAYSTELSIDGVSVFGSPKLCRPKKPKGPQLFHDIQMFTDTLVDKTSF